MTTVYTFDASDQATWPKTKHAPSGSNWLCQASDGFISQETFSEQLSKYPRTNRVAKGVKTAAAVWKGAGIIKYCDPGEIFQNSNSN